jgi:hypothetical protein
MRTRSGTYLRLFLFLSLPYLLSSLISQMPLEESLATKGGVLVASTVLICDQFAIKIEAQIMGFLLFWGRNTLVHNFDL